MVKIIEKNTKTIIFTLLLACFIFSGCGLTGDGSDSNETARVNIDYSNSQRWLSLPPAADKKVDVFYLYPTSYQKAGTNEANICEIDNPLVMSKAQSAFSTQATAFETFANIYAPYYRQVDARYSLSLPLAEQDKILSGIPVSDARTAFDHYIKNYNKNRPFILAGHSQGANVLLYLLSDYMKENPQVYARMIAAYVIGYSITPSYLAENPHLKFAAGPDDTGVIISYNTEGPVTGMASPVVLPGAIVINPISWTLAETLAPAAENAGSMALNPDFSIAARDVKNYADAQVSKSRGVLICSTIDADRQFPGNALIKMGIYHNLDFALYYNNIRDNAANRAAKFLNKK
ncbi:MAG: hypothetical protein BWY32_03299 [bacterium ADurb.Bin243]|nr:MAG: hypothetical protein BWY32_03299 [bacterium ADurb.Bin243]